ncbi:MAG: ribosome biogenesis GTPase Der [Candidatus Chaera renei]|uniref:GTPase Der n=1 Tax=Candidatus Chaera renei TaxID=2506947 RepID=A0A4Q0AGG3_9BACT|nr:MAG: ribosome biogenesis GTPase Der [Candidatus Chaera renei]
MSKPLPTVAIVGRANAGKSSLFNRLVGAPQAIVAREAGTTRDNVIGRVELDGRFFWLVDTAGLKQPGDDFEASIQQQITEAAEAADVILVVADATLYPGDEDRLVAKKALKSGKPVVLVLNKTDLKQALPDQEFLRLGIKQIVRVSARQGRTERLEAILAPLIPPRRQPKDDGVIRLALIGRPNAGKSSLFNRLAGKQQALVNPAAGTTRDTNRVTVGYMGQRIELMDTAGIRRSGRVEVGVEKFSVLRALQAIDQSDVCLLLMDGDEAGTQLDQKLAGMIKQAGKGLILVITKWDDLRRHNHSDGWDDLAKRLAADFAFVPWAPLLPTSSITGRNLTKLLELALDINQRRHQNVPTSQLNQILRRCVAKHPPAGLKNSQPKLLYITQTDVAPPWFVIFGRQFNLLHWSYKRFLERSLRDEIDFTGTPINLSFHPATKRPEEARA